MYYDDSDNESRYSDPRDYDEYDDDPYDYEEYYREEMDYNQYDDYNCRMSEFAPTDFSCFSNLLTSEELFEEEKSVMIDVMLSYYRGLTVPIISDITRMWRWMFERRCMKYGQPQETVNAAFDEIVEIVLEQLTERRREQERLAEEERVRKLRERYTKLRDYVVSELERSFTNMNIPYQQFVGVNGFHGIREFAEVRDASLSYNEEFLDLMKRALVRRVTNSGHPRDCREAEGRFATLYTRVNGDKSQFLEQVAPEFVEFLTKLLPIAPGKEVHREWLLKQYPEISFDFKLERFVGELLSSTTYCDKLFELVAYVASLPSLKPIVYREPTKAETEKFYADFAGVSVGTLERWRDEGPRTLNQHYSVVGAYGREYGMCRHEKLRLEQKEEEREARWTMGY